MRPGFVGSVFRYERLVWNTAQMLARCLSVVMNNLVAVFTDADQYHLSTAHWHRD